MRGLRLSRLCCVPRGDRRGTVAIMTAILGGALAGFVALATDVGTWEADRSAMQGAADQAAMAASYAIASGTPAAQKEARGLAAASGFLDGVAGVSVAVNIPPQSGADAGVARAIEVVISRPQQLLLCAMVTGAPPMATARAVAVPGPVNTCIMALAPFSPGITGIGLGTVAANCNIYVNSTVSPGNCDVSLTGAVALVGYDVFLGQPPCTGVGITSVAAAHRLRINAAPAADPYAARTIPAPTAPCMPAPTLLQFLQPVLTLNPGTYCGDIVAKGNVVLNPGVYVFDNASLLLLVPATLTGSGVSLVFTSSTGSGYGTLVAAVPVTLNLTAMTTGPTAGIAIWLDPAGRQSLVLATALTVLNITGAIYAPAYSSIVNVLGITSMPCTQVIAGQIIFAGVTTVRHNCAGLGTADVIAYKLLE
ncbi:MAG: pilus assembly protein TadG-related protein [Janthinobacterium lividum]